MAVFDKLKHEWKTFTVAVMATVAGAWQIAVTMGATLPDLFAWVPDQYKSATLFGFGFLMLVLRQYKPKED